MPASPDLDALERDLRDANTPSPDGMGWNECGERIARIRNGGASRLLNAAPSLLARCRDLEAIVSRIAEADPDGRLGAVKVWDLPGRPGEAEGYTAEYIQGAARRLLGVCVDCDGMGRTRTDGGHGNIIDEECSTCHPGPAAGEEG